MEHIPCHTAHQTTPTAQQQLEHWNCAQLYRAFLVESVWLLFWWCPLLSVDCFHKLCLSGTQSENSWVGWDLGNSMARGYWFYAKWVCPMGSYVWGIQVFCSRNEVAPHFSDRTEHLNTSGITSHGTDSFHIKLIAPGHYISMISNHPTIFWGVPERQRLWKQSIDKRGRHQKRNQMDSTSNAQ